MPVLSLCIIFTLIVFPVLFIAQSVMTLLQEHSENKITLQNDRKIATVKCFVILKTLGICKCGM